MAPFHSGMNHWQRKWLSDRLHKKRQLPPAPEITQPVAVSKPKRTPRKKPGQEPPAE